jgi:hypothetical protein
MSPPVAAVCFVALVLALVGWALCAAAGNADDQRAEWWRAGQDRPEFEPPDLEGDDR